MPKGYPNKAGVRKLSPANRCAVCRHPERSRIEALHVSGKSFEKLAEQFDLKRDAIWRHVHKHMTDERKASYLVGAAKIAQLAEVAAEESQSLVDYLSIMRSTLFAQFDRLAEAKDHQGVALISQRLIDVLREFGKATGQINTLASSTVINVQNNVQILNSPPFADLQAGLLRICADHPDARRDIVALFHDLDHKYASAPPAPMIEVREIANAG
jgi:hypothetical protein